MDVTNSISCQAAIENVVSRYGSIDGLVNASGVYNVAPALQLSDSAGTHDHINLTGAFRLARAAGVAMTRQKSGSIVTVTSFEVVQTRATRTWQVRQVQRN